VSQELADSTDNAPYSSDNIRKLLETAQNLHNLKATGNTTPADTTLAATARRKFKSTRPYLPGHNHPAGVKCCQTCATHNRPCARHDTQFCAHPGSAMEKQGFTAAHNAARIAGASKGKPSGGSKVYTQLTGPQGKIYLVKDGDLGKFQTLSTEVTTPIAFAGLAMDSIPQTPSVDDIEWEGWMATIMEEEELLTSLDWKHTPMKLIL
ncbi:hypothetical protein C0995_013898, partial [Termitomyces sp. Mi166